jgi:hypothetical protein
VSTSRAGQETPKPRAPPRRESARGTQPCENHADKPTDRCFGWHAPGRCEGKEAVARELVGPDVVSEVAGLYALGQQLSDEGSELLLCSGDVLTSM